MEKDPLIKSGELADKELEKTKDGKKRKRIADFISDKLSKWLKPAEYQQRKAEKLETADSETASPDIGEKIVTFLSKRIDFLKPQLDLPGKEESEDDIEKPAQPNKALQLAKRIIEIVQRPFGRENDETVTGIDKDNDKPTPETDYYSGGKTTGRNLSFESEPPKQTEEKKRRSFRDIFQLRINRGTDNKKLKQEFKELENELDEEEQRSEKLERKVEKLESKLTKETRVKMETPVPQRSEDIEQPVIQKVREQYIEKPSERTADTPREIYDSSELKIPEHKPQIEPEGIVSKIREIIYERESISPGDIETSETTKIEKPLFHREGKESIFFTKAKKSKDSSIKAGLAGAVDSGISEKKKRSGSRSSIKNFRPSRQLASGKLEAVTLLLLSLLAVAAFLLLAKVVLG